MSLNSEVIKSQENENNKMCFVIMPISNQEGYDKDHFDRVYEYVIKPAIIKAGFIPKRADDVKNTNFIALDIIKYLLDSEMALCDLSSRNPNVLYELGIRQAFDKPVTLIKDFKTPRVFDIQNIRDIEYSEKLRIDEVNASINRISEAIINTYEKQGKDVNSLVSLLGVHAAKVKPQEIGSNTKMLFDALESLDSRVDEMIRYRNMDIHMGMLKVEENVKKQVLEDLAHMNPDQKVNYATNRYLKRIENKL